MKKALCLFVTALAATLCSSTYMNLYACTDDVETICDSAKYMQKWLTEDVRKYPQISSYMVTEEFAKLLPRVQKLCVTMPTADTIRYGAAVSWFTEADAIGEELARKASVSDFKRILAWQSYLWQKRLDKMRIVAYDAAKSKDGGLSEKGFLDSGLTISVNPWAYVLYNGKKALADRTTPLVITDLKPGNYTFAFESANFETIQRTITVLGVPQAIYVNLAEEAPTKFKLSH